MKHLVDYVVGFVGVLAYNYMGLKAILIPIVIVTTFVSIFIKGYLVNKGNKNKTTKLE